MACAPGEQLDNLDHLAEALGNRDGRFWRMRNGYTLSGPRQLDALTEAIGAADREALLECLKIGLHEDIAVTMKDAQGALVAETSGPPACGTPLPKFSFRGTQDAARAADTRG